MKRSPMGCPAICPVPKHSEIRYVCSLEGHLTTWGPAIAREPIMSAQETEEPFDVAVLGAGIVGTCSAAWLRKRGHNVALIDRGEPGGGTSFGNAGIFAENACIPLNHPSLPLRLPKLLLSSESPLTIEWSQVPRMTPWLVRFLANCSAENVERITNGLASLSRHAGDGMMPLIEDAGAQQLMRARGSLYLYDKGQDLGKLERELEIRRHHGATLDLLGPEEIGQMEPNLAKNYGPGIYNHDTPQYLDPQGAVMAIAEQFARDGGTMVTADVTHIVKGQDGLLQLRSPGKTVACRQLVLAAGAFSRRLFGGLIEHLPLETERGYHVAFDGHDGLLNRPVGVASGGFFMSPMSSGLRVAGTVELGGLSDKKRAANLRHIMRQSRRLLPELPDAPSSTWVGHRPTMPDSLPVIGRSTRTREIILAFGHQHLGMTLGGVTGRMVADIIGGTEPIVDPAPFAADRFQKGRRRG
jgi:D-amino-acid dehydrogenase